MPIGTLWNIFEAKGHDYPINKRYLIRNEGIFVHVLGVIIIWW
jgi:hypothetical protein